MMVLSEKNASVVMIKNSQWLGMYDFLHRGIDLFEGATPFMTYPDIRSDLARVNKTGK
jgi:hypothetical protein